MSSDNVLGQVEEIARDVLDQARNSLMATFRFMDVALWRMPHVPKKLQRAVATDGYRFYFDALTVVMRFREAPDEITRDYLHCILHCVFRHQFDEHHEDTKIWDLCCDIAVEASVLELCGKRFSCKHDNERIKLLAILQKTCPQLTAQKLYRVFTAGSELQSVPPVDIERCTELFSRDDHEVWTRTEERQSQNLHVTKQAKIMAPDDGQSVKGDSVQGSEEDPEEKAGMNSPGAPAPSTGGSVAEGEVENGDRFVGVDSLDEAQASFASMDNVEIGDFENITWKDISGQIEMDMEAFSGKIGTTSGSFLINLSVANRKKYDYSDFLKRFSSLSEELKVSTEEFDYVYYTYGLRLYKNMPLVEPLEYQESRRVRDFVIAIDTSASCGGALVKRFVEKTYDVLKSESGFGRKVNVHVIQCDSDIRKVTKISSMNDIDDNFMDFQVRGFGGTDFRPVFKYVEEKQALREFTDLKGLIYLTDGLGKYPERAPEYDVAFVFVDVDQRERKVPPWAMKVVMDEDQIMEL